MYLFSVCKECKPREPPSKCVRSRPQPSALIRSVGLLFSDINSSNRVPYCPLNNGHLCTRYKYTSGSNASGYFSQLPAFAMFSAAFPAGTILAAILVLIPLPSHWRARNVATLSLIGWLFVMNLIYAVNSFVWSDNSQPRLLVWCDISE